MPVGYRTYFPQVSESKGCRNAAETSSPSNDLELRTFAPGLEGPRASHWLEVTRLALVRVHAIGVRVAGESFQHQASQHQRSNPTVASAPGEAFKPAAHRLRQGFSPVGGESRCRVTEACGQLQPGLLEFTRLNPGPKPRGLVLDGPRLLPPAL